MSANIAIAQLLFSAFIVSVTLVWGIFRYRRGDYRRRDRFAKLQAYLLWIFGGLVGVSMFYPLSFLYTEHLWYENLGYEGIFWRDPSDSVGVLPILLHHCCGVHGTSTLRLRMFCVLNQGPSDAGRIRRPSRSIGPSSVSLSSWHF